jgi:hypothetical protein
MLKKVKSFLCNPGKAGKAVASISVVAVVIAMFATMAFANTTASMEGIVTELLDVILQIFFYIGILLLAWSVGMLVLAFKNEDADSKSRAMMLLVVSIALIALQPLLDQVIPELTAPTWS